MGYPYNTKLRYLISYLVLLSLIPIASLSNANEIKKILIDAMVNQDIPLIEDIVNSSDIKETQYLGDTPLIFYAVDCYPKSLKYLIDIGFDISIKMDTYTLKPISFAVSKSSIPCYEMLKARGALIDLDEKEKYDLLINAILERNNVIINDLMELGFDYLDNKFGLSPIEYAVYSDRSYLFIDHIRSKYKTDNIAINCCAQIAQTRDDEIAKDLVDAIKRQNVDDIEAIIVGNSIEYIENTLVNNTQPIFYASACYPIALSYLIDSSFDINILHAESNIRPIVFSAISDDIECYNILMSKGALSKLTDKEQYEFMSSMILRRNQQVIDDLIKQGFSYLDDQFGVSAIEYAIDNDRSYLFTKHIKFK